MTFFFLAEGEIGASCCVDPCGVPGCVGVAHGYLRPLGAKGKVGTGSGSHAGGVLEGGDARDIQSTSGYTQSGVDVVVAVGVVGAGGRADSCGPDFLGGSGGHGNQSQKRCLEKWNFTSQRCLDCLI